METLEMLQTLRNLYPEKYITVGLDSYYYEPNTYKFLIIIHVQGVLHVEFKTILEAQRYVAGLVEKKTPKEKSLHQILTEELNDSANKPTTKPRWTE
jgi:hypothetical protein